MPLSTDDIFEVLSLLSKNKNLKVTLNESLKGGLLAGTMTVAGGLLGGPPGLAIGAAVGGCVAAANAYGKFKPVYEVLADMPPNERKELTDRFVAIFDNIDAHDVATVLLLLASNERMGEQVLKILTGYITNDLKLKLCA